MIETFSAGAFSGCRGGMRARKEEKKGMHKASLVAFPYFLLRDSIFFDSLSNVFMVTQECPLVSGFSVLVRRVALLVR